MVDLFHTQKNSQLLIRYIKHTVVIAATQFIVHTNQGALNSLGIALPTPKFEISVNPIHHQSN